MNDLMMCQKIKCKDYLTDEGDPAWCYRAGCPAKAAIGKCPKAGNQNRGKICQSEDPTMKNAKNKK